MLAEHLPGGSGQVACPESLQCPPNGHYNDSLERTHNAFHTDSNLTQQQPGDIHSDRLEAILANAVDTIITIDARGKVESVNPAMQRMFGYEASEVVGQNVSMLMPSPDREQHDGYLKNYHQSRERKIIGIGREVMARRKDGSTFPVHLAVSEIVMDGNRLFAGVLRDITDLKAAEKQLAIANAELEKRIHERDQNLVDLVATQQKLLQNERLAAIGQMVAGLAHESRNTLQKSHACLTNLEFDVRAMPESLSLIGKVKGALDHLEGLLEEVRNYSAPIVLELQNTDVTGLFTETWEQIKTSQPTATEIQFSLACDDTDAGHIKVDRYRLGQVIWNLLENARVSFGRDAVDCEICVTICNTSTDDSAGDLSCEVRDNGSGISEENLSSIFNPFFTTKTRGTGLGLAICRRIVEAHDGTLNVASELGTGTTFTIRLPRPGATKG